LVHRGHRSKRWLQRSPCPVVNPELTEHKMVKGFEFTVVLFADDRIHVDAGVPGRAAAGQPATDGWRLVTSSNEPGRAASAVMDLACRLLSESAIQSAPSSISNSAIASSINEPLVGYVTAQSQSVTPSCQGKEPLGHQQWFTSAEEDAAARIHLGETRRRFQRSGRSEATLPALLVWPKSCRSCSGNCRPCSFRYTAAWEAEARLGVDAIGPLLLSF